MAKRPRIGRPTREESQRRQEELLECALDTFLERGFEQTTMEQIAITVGMSKRTVYARYPDKDSLFKAAVRRAIERYTVPLETLQAVETEDLEETLTAVARIRISNVATPTGIKLQRILSTQSFRFPELFEDSFRDTTGATIEFLSGLFIRHNARGNTSVEDPEQAAFAFLSMVVGGPARLITYGSHISEEEIEKRVRFSVHLFLNGICPR